MDIHAALASRLRSLRSAITGGVSSTKRRSKPSAPPSMLEPLEKRVLLSSVSFTAGGFSSYDATQDLSGGAIVIDAGKGVEFSGNSWKKTPLNYNVTPNTVLEFDFSSTNEADTHAVGFDENTERLDARRMFQVHGTKAWVGNPKGAFQNFNNYPGSGTRHYAIPVGQYYTGGMKYLTFANDGDTNPGSGRFSNVSIHEGTASTPGGVATLWKEEFALANGTKADTGSTAWTIAGHEHRRPERAGASPQHPRRIHLDQPGYQYQSGRHGHPLRRRGGVVLGGVGRLPPPQLRAGRRGEVVVQRQRQLLPQDRDCYGDQRVDAATHRAVPERPGRRNLLP